MMGIFRAFGAVFLNSPEKPDRNRSSGQSTDGETPSRGTVLVIDDDAATLEVLRPLLRAEGFTVMTAQSGAKGLDLLRYAQRDILVVVLDYNMPRLNGADTLQFVRKLSPRVKVLGLTGIEAELLPESFRMGADKILTKPCTNSELLRHVNDLLGFDPAKIAGAN
jgi:CheY-like chemotaxis protein